jgi:uncharacterized protein YjbI with pentapeptide repeats
MDAEELLGRYAAGERDFSGADLSGVKLMRAHLPEINLSDAKLRGANFVCAELNGANFSRLTVFFTKPSGRMGMSSPIRIPIENNFRGR